MIKSYRPVSLLNVNIFSKIYETSLQENLTNHVNTFLSKFISASPKSYRSNHVLIRLIESGKKSLDQKSFVGAVLTDSSKAFGSILHDFIVKMNNYSFSKKLPCIILIIFERRKQNVRICNTRSIFQILLSGVPQRSILGLILFKIFISDLFLGI